MAETAEDIIQFLELQVHPEGGYYRETYRSKDLIPYKALPAGFKSDRSVSTAIFFMLESGNFSAFHRIRSDETWHFYTGDPLEVIEIAPTGDLIITTLGSDFKQGECFQYTVQAGHWFASRVKEGGAYSLVGCTVAPGFDFMDFEMAEREKLILAFPQHAEIIKKLTRLASV